VQPHALRHLTTVGWRSMVISRTTQQLATPVSRRTPAARRENRQVGFGQRTGGCARQSLARRGRQMGPRGGDEPLARKALPDPGGWRRHEESWT